MTISFDIQPADVMVFTSHYVRTDKAVRRSRRLVTWFPIIVYMFISLMSVASEERSLSSGVRNFVLFSLLYIGLITLSYKRAPKRMAKQLYSNPDNHNLFGNREMTFTDEFIAVKGDKFDSKIAWNMIVRAADAGTHFLLYTGANQAYIIPKGQITEQDAEMLKSLFEQHNLFK